MSVLPKSISVRTYSGGSLAVLLVTRNEVMLACGGQDKEVSEEGAEKKAQQRFMLRR